MRKENTLECGRTIDSVWESLERPLDEHQRTCTYCQEARTSLLKLLDLTRQVRQEDEELNIQSGTRDRIMDFARTHVRRGADIPVYEDRGSAISVSQFLVAQAVQETVDSFAGLTVRRSVVRPRKDGQDGVQSFDLTVSLVMSPSVRLPAVERELRQAIVTRINERLGGEVRILNLLIEDVQYDETD